ncbi:hypothetical protein [Mesorhizobium marinum]|uniref:DUF4239 domain-containing protein n=1 Tax=Mesorhizobium marinum TaxID=3228790 RepID=A0ABV3QWD6_9HYPH
MSLVAAIAERSVVAFGLLLFLFQMLAHEVGYRLGRRDNKRSGGNPETVGVVVGGMLALLAFVLALTLSFSNTRFGELRRGSLAETNAISTAWLRAKAIGDERAETIADLLVEYTQVRADFTHAGRDKAAIDALNLRTAELQSEIWGNLSDIVRERPDPVSASLMAALNETFDMSAAERFAFELALPTQLFWLLIGMSLVGVASLGYQFGLKDKTPKLLVALFVVMLTSVIVVILDLASARLGNFRVAAPVYEQTLEGFRSGAPLP